MNEYVTGETIRDLREKKGYTQKELADLLSLSDKTISKWETGKGLPDSVMLAPLAAALGVSVSELLRGEQIVNQNRSANMLRGKFFVCPLCGNVIFAAGNAEISCCGIHLPPLDAEKDDADHKVTIELIENEYYITMDHPMTKEHYISFLAHVTGERVQIVKWYPEQNPETRIPRVRRGKLYAYCNRHGLFEVAVL
ncbi:MAG: helix-turn-helix domain-containing protein [Firmicutes bacterium]|nr:helix-turn-helix domain-containing protein [Bacillota bacterium]